MPLTSAERSKRRIAKLKSEGNYESYKLRRNLIAKRSRDKLKKEMEELPVRIYLRKSDEARQKTRDRVQKHRQNKKTLKISKTSSQCKAVSLLQQSVPKNMISLTDDVHEISVHLNRKIVMEVPNENQEYSVGLVEKDLKKVLDKPIIIPNNSTKRKRDETFKPELDLLECVNATKRARNRNVHQKKVLSSAHDISGEPAKPLIGDTISEQVLSTNLHQDTFDRNNVQEISAQSHCHDQEISDELSNEATINTANSSFVKSVSEQPQKISQRKKRDNDRERIRNRVRKYRENKKSVQEPSVYRTEGTLRKAVSRAKQALPKCPNKRKAVVMKLYEKYVDPSKAAKMIRPRISGLSQKVKESVVKFYERDDISGQAPGRKDFVRIVDANGDKTTIQLKHLMYPIRRVYTKYCTETQSIPLRISKFFELRPKHVVPVNQMPHTVCLCPYHENFIYAINALHKIVPEVPEYGDDFYATFFCEDMTKDCWFGVCKTCRDVFGDTFLGLSEYFSKKSPNVKWMVWKEIEWEKDGKKMGKRWEKTQQSGTVKDIVNYILGIATKFFRHSFVKREQLKAYHEDVDSMDNSVAIIHLDFAESYTCVSQDEIQNGHYHQRQLTVFTAAIWICKKIRSYSIISDDLDHSKTVIIPYVERLLEELPDEIKTVHIWSDGPRKQFKNKFIAASLPVLENKYNMNFVWNYFATSHGKGPVDGIGGALKRQVWTSVKSRECEVRNASEFMKAVKKESKINVILMDKENVEKRLFSLNMHQTWSEAVSIRGISDFHSLKVIDGKVTGKLVTKDF